MASGNLRKRGGFYEGIVARELVKLGYSIVDHNVQARFGEVDIVAKKGGSYYFVEVRYKGSEEFGSPKESITRTKLLHMRRSMEFLAKQRRYDSCYLGFVGVKSLEAAEKGRDHSKGQNEMPEAEGRRGRAKGAESSQGGGYTLEVDGPRGHELLEIEMLIPIPNY